MGGRWLGSSYEVRVTPLPSSAHDPKPRIFYRKAIAIARDYAHRRRAFGKPLTEHPLHLRTLANQEVMYRGCLQFAFFLAVLQVQHPIILSSCPREAVRVILFV